MSDFFKVIILFFTTILSVLLGFMLWIMCSVNEDLMNVIEIKNNKINEITLENNECRYELTQSNIMVDGYQDLIDKGYLIENYPSE